MWPDKDRKERFSLEEKHEKVVLFPGFPLSRTRQAVVSGFLRRTACIFQPAICPFRLRDSVALISLDKLVLQPDVAKSGWVAERESAAPTALGIIVHRCPSPSGLGSRLADGPFDKLRAGSPGLDQLRGRTFRSSTLTGTLHVVVTG
jgi:hypothetical protein